MESYYYRMTGRLAAAARGMALKQVKRHHPYAKLAAKQTAQETMSLTLRWYRWFYRKTGGM